ncbi:phage head completion protein [Leuconostoc citreum]
MQQRSFTIQQSIDKETSIGDIMPFWDDFGYVNGYLDLLAGTDINTSQNAMMEQSTHILIVPSLPNFVITDKMRIVDEKKYYSVTYVDDPVSQHHHLELYLTFGGYNV